MINIVSMVSRSFFSFKFILLLWVTYSEQFFPNPFQEKKTATTTVFQRTLIFGASKTGHVFLEHGCPRRQQSQSMAKSPSPTFWTRPTPAAYDVNEVKATLRFFYMNLWFNFDPILKYYTLKRMNRITDKRKQRQIDGQKDDPITRFPLDLSGQGHKNVSYIWQTDGQTDKWRSPRSALLWWWHHNPLFWVKHHNCYFVLLLYTCWKVMFAFCVNTSTSCSIIIHL